MTRHAFLWLAAAMFCTGVALSAGAQQLNVICAVQAEWCTLAATEFERETGIKATMALKGSGEAFAQIAAEKANRSSTCGSVATGDPHLQAAELGLTEEYRSPLISQLQPWAQKQAEQSKHRSVGLYPRRPWPRLQHRAPGQEKAAGARVLEGSRQARIRG
jgi:iron(III) transport system substrate-binding protein